MQNELKTRVRELIDDVMEEVVSIRHQIHQNPDLTWQEKPTHEYLLSILKQVPQLEIDAPIAKHGIVATLQGGKPGPVTALRADMDALPLTEKSDLAYKSCKSGAMHACGHDGHMANLVGAIKVLSELKDDVCGTLKFIFQPAEEGGAGALAMCEDGVLQKHGIERIFGLHGWPEQQLGKVFVKSGPMMASQCVLEFKISGIGCHAAMPHLGTDQVYVASQLVVSLQGLVSRTTCPTDPVCLSITQVQGGTAVNIIPDEVTLRGTLRTMSKDTQQTMLDRIAKIANSLAESWGVSIEFSPKPGYPPTVNHENETRHLAEVAKDMIGRDNVQWLAEPTMGAEDFSYFLERVPGSYFFLGLNDRKDGYPSLHHPQFDFNDKALKTGIAVFCGLALVQEI